MHLIWENLIPNLVQLWTGKFKEHDHTDKPYVLAPSVWDAIGEASASSGKTIPSAFSSRVPNVVQDGSQLKAETTSLWTLYLALVLLQNHFKSPKFYKHFVELVRLLNLCLNFEISNSELKSIWQGFQDWVLEYERYVQVFKL